MSENRRGDFLTHTVDFIYPGLYLANSVSCSVYYSFTNYFTECAKK